MAGPIRPAGPATTPRTWRATPELAAVVGRAAAAAGLTEGAWVRSIVAAAANAALPPGELQPVRAYRSARPPPTADVVALARLREAVGEATGTLRQVAGLDRDRGGSRLAELDTAIDRLLAAVADLDAAKAGALGFPPDQTP